MSFPPRVEKDYNSIQLELANKVDSALSGPKSVINTWLDNLKELCDSVGEMDSLATAEALLILESLELSTEFLETRLEGTMPSLSTTARARELAVVYEQFLVIYNKVKASRAEQIKKLLPEEETEDKVENSAKTDDSKELRMNLDDLDDGELEQAHAENGIYKAPKTDSTALLMASKSKSERAEDAFRRKEKEAERLRRSHIVKAFTEEYSEAPIIHDDGFDQLDAASRHTIKRLEMIEEAEIEHMGRLGLRKSNDNKKFTEIKTKQKLLTKGDGLGDISSFVDQLGNKQPSKSSKRAQKTGKSVKKKGKKHHKPSHRK